MNLTKALDGKKVFNKLDDAAKAIRFISNTSTYNSKTQIFTVKLSACDVINYINEPDKEFSFDPIVKFSQIYSFFYKSCILYIGKSDNNLRGRLRDHLFGGNAGNKYLMEMLCQNPNIINHMIIKLIVLRSSFNFESNNYDEVSRWEKHFIKNYNPVCNTEYCDILKSRLHPDIDMPNSMKARIISEIAAKDECLAILHLLNNDFADM